MNKLDGFEKMIKGSLEGFELPFDSAMWSQMERSLGDSSNTPNELDAFEKKVKESGESLDVPYDRSQWKRLEQSLRPSGGMPLKWLAVASVAGVIGAGILLYNTFGNEEEISKNPSAYDLVQNDQRHDLVTGNDLVKDSSSSNSEKSSIVSPEGREKIQAICNTVNNKEKEKATTDVAPVLPKEDDNNTLSKSQEETQKKTDDSQTREENSSQLVDQKSEELKQNKKLPVPLMQVLSEEFCSGQEVEFTAGNIPDDCICQWEINKNGLPVRTNNLTYYFAEPGNYTISLQFISGNNVSSVVEKNIIVKPSPQISFDWSDEVVNGKPYVHFRNNSHDIVSSKWIFNNGSTSQEKDPVRFFRYKGEYQIGLTATGSNGCQSKTIRTLRIEKDYNLFAPNAFSPNGDNTNNTFIPEALKVMDVEFTMTIYTRDNKLVYQTKSVDSPWDGRFMSDNQAAPEGTYVWVVSIPGEEPYIGYVTIVK